MKQVLLIIVGVSLFAHGVNFFLQTDEQEDAEWFARYSEAMEKNYVEREKSASERSAPF